MGNLNGQAKDLAYLTHYLHNYTKGNVKLFEKKATKYFNNIFNNSELQQIFPIKWDIPFPSPENVDFTFIDLFAGIGGFRLAAQKVGGKCVFSSEWDRFSQMTYEMNFGEVPFGDITKFKENRIPTHDILFAGFPCQPFSYSGKNEGFKDKTRGTLFSDIVRIIKYHQPKMFLLENVKGLKSHNNGKTLETIIESLKNLGYDIHWKILRSYDFELPQMRERWYCVGSSKPIDFTFPVGHGKKVKIRDIIDKNNDDKKLGLSDFEIKRIAYHFEKVTKELPRVEHDSSNYGSDTKKGRHGVFSFQKKDGSLRFHIGDRAKTQIQESFYSTLDSYSSTIIANRVPKLWDLGRKLSVKEAQRLQGFSNEFTFPVSDNQAYKQIGNSVSVPVVEMILHQMKKYL
jgi:DNA (cytosine-5)-methyltransferase 1